jgi:WD40 repeat protein
VDECARIGMALADALQYLHRHQLSHRDIKPSNVILVHGIPKLADIGLVTEIGPAPTFIGTEGFIAPEGPGTSQADIFSLGMVLYELSTGRDRHDFPAWPENADAAADVAAFREFNEVILRACHSDVRHRYATAQEMSQDLLLLTRGQSVKRLQKLEHQRQYLRKAGIWALFAGLALFGVLYPLYQKNQYVRANQQRQVGTLTAEGIHAMNAGDMIRAAVNFTEALKLPAATPQNETDQRLRLAGVLALTPKLEFVINCKNFPSSAVFSPDGTQILIAQHIGEVSFWDLAQKTLCTPLTNNPVGLGAAEYSPDGQYFVTAAYERTASLWEVKTGRRLHQWVHPHFVHQATFNPTGTRILTACHDGKVREYDCATGQLLGEYLGHQNPVLTARYSPDGQWIITGGWDNTARLWRVADRQTVSILPHTSWVLAACFSPDGQHILTGSFDRAARIWEVATGKLIRPTMPHEDGVTSVAYSPDGRHIATASFDNHVRLWETSTQTPVQLNARLDHGSRVHGATFSPDGRRLVTACQDGNVRVWNLAASGLIPEQTQGVIYHPASQHYLIPTNRALHAGLLLAPDRATRPLPVPVGLKKTGFSEDGQWFYTLHTNRPTELELHIWDFATGNPVGPPITLPIKTTIASFSRRGQALITLERTNARVWQVTTGLPLSPPLPHPDQLESAQFHPQGRTFILWGGNQLWHYDLTGKPVFSVIKHPDKIHAAAFSPYGQTLVTGFSNAQIYACWGQLWDAQTGAPIGQKLMHRDGVLAAAFSPDGKKIATSGEDFIARVWDVQTSRALTPPLRHQDQIHGVAFSPDNHWVATASIDGTARVWNAETGEALTPPIRHGDTVWDVQFLSDPHYLWTYAGRSRNYLWHLPTEQRPVAELEQWTTLLGGKVSERLWLETGPTNQIGQTFYATWTNLQARYPADFTLNHAEATYWHQRQASQSEADQQRSAALFHVKQLLTLDPENPTLKQRLATLDPRLPQ